MTTNEGDGMKGAGEDVEDISIKIRAVRPICMGGNRQMLGESSHKVSGTEMGGSTLGGREARNTSGGARTD